MKFAFLKPLLEIAVLLLVVLGVLRWVTGLFSKRTAVYQLTAARQMRMLFWPLLAFGAGLSVLPAVLLGGPQTTMYEWLLAGGFFLFTLALSGPALLLFLRYWVLNHANVLIFNPEENQFEVYEAGRRVAFERRDLVQVERVTCRARRTFWARYDYVRLHLADGRSLVLTSLLTDLEPLTIFLRNLPINRHAKTWCWV